MTTKKKNKPAIKSKNKNGKSVDTDEDDQIGPSTDILNTDSIQSINVETPEEDVVSVFRDVMTMTDDERFSIDDNTNLSSIRMSPPPKPNWCDDPKNVKFNIGQKVTRKYSREKVVYCVSEYGKDEKTYCVVPSKSMSRFTFKENELTVAPKNAEWVKYWDTIPVIPAPKLKKK